MQISHSTIDWLLEEEQPVVRYFTFTDLLDKKPNAPEVLEAREDILKRGWVHDILQAQKPGGYWESGECLYDPKYVASNWRMIALSDFGLSYKDSKQIERGCDQFFEKWLKDEREFYAKGEAEVCIIGNLARFLTRFGYATDSRVTKLFHWLVENQKEDGGWHCLPSETGTLDCWEALAAFAALPRSKWNKGIKKSVERGAGFYMSKNLFKEGKPYAPWLRFHYPTHYYYDVLVGLDTLTALGFGGDKRLRPALKILDKKQIRKDLWKLDKVHPDIGRGANYSLRKAVKPFTLEKAGRPSKWITLAALRVKKRVSDQA